MQAIINLYETYSEALHAIQELEAAKILPDAISLIALTTKTENLDLILDVEEEEKEELTLVNPAPDVKGNFFSRLDLLPFDDIGTVVTAGWLIAEAKKNLPATDNSYGSKAMRTCLVDCMIETGLDKQHAETYAEGIRHGGTLIGVKIDPAQETTAITIMQKDHKPLQPHMRGAHFSKQAWSQKTQDRVVKTNRNQSMLITIPAR